MSRKNQRTLLPKAIKQNNRHHGLQQKAKISQSLKQKYIQDLQQRNRKLKQQIAKITQLLEDHNQKEKQKPLKKKQHKLIKEEVNPEFLKKQLQNVYKQIKNYEREIQKLENQGAGSRLASDQIARLQNIRIQKMSHLQKLKNQLADLNTTQVQNVRKLKNNMGRQHYETLTIKLSQQMKVLRDKLRVVLQKQKQRIANAKKQLQYIKKLQRELVENGISLDQLQQMKKKSIYNQIYQIMNGQKQPKQEEKLKEKPKGLQLQEQPIGDQQITYQQLNQMKNQSKLYLKLHQDYEKRLAGITKEKQNIDKTILTKKNLLTQKSTEIGKLQEELNEIKAIVRKSNTIQGTVGPNQSIKKIMKKKSMNSNNNGGLSPSGGQNGIMNFPLANSQNAHK